MQKNALRRARVTAEEVPIPCCTDSSVIIANRHSLISAGTETAAVGSTKGDMIKKAMRDSSIRQSVVDMLVQDGVQKTSDRVLYEMGKWTALGYSGAGIAIEVGRRIEGIKPGDVVAYGGEHHAEFVRAAKNLCVAVPEGVSTGDAAFVTVGSIAMQAVRRAEIQVGDTVAVIGLGLVGQLVTQILNASGARIFGTDMLQSRLELGKQSGLEEAIHAGQNVVEIVRRRTGGVGVDRVILCAGNTTRELLQQAVSMSRERGRLVVVGGGTLDVPRDEFYMKEMDLMISRSYGPGRYDKQYEEQGVDYPISYVRWTENRNMQEFLRLIQVGKLNLKPLVTHQFAVDQAERGYDLLMSQPGECLGILLEYDSSLQPQREPVQASVKKVTPSTAARPKVAVIGCGAFAQQFHLPNLKNSSLLTFHSLAASTAQSAKEMALRFGAANATTDIEHLMGNSEIEAVMVFTRDKSHAGLCAAALRADKHVFCEKPLATTLAECAMLESVAAQSNRVCMTGFNRRFAPMMQVTKGVLARLQAPKIIHFRVNAGPLPPNNWVYDAAHSEGRIVGEACHFIDLFRWLTGREIVKVSATQLGACPSSERMEDLVATFEFDDGSVANLIYAAVGNKQVGKERLEVFCEGTAIIVDDYRQLTVRGCATIDQRSRRIDKGHNAEFEHFAAAVTGREEPMITFLDGIQATRACLAILKSARSHQPIWIDELTDEPI